MLDFRAHCIAAYGNVPIGKTEASYENIFINLTTQAQC